MITAIWCEKSALIVGWPRRTFEWSTESSCTTLARCTSSATAAIAVARAPPTVLERAREQEQRGAEHLALHPASGARSPPR